MPRYKNVDGQRVPFTAEEEAARDAEEAAEAVKELARQRASASMSRTDFAIAAAVAGYVTFDVAEEWAAGNAIPAEIVTAIGEMAPELQGPARITARSKDRIDRNGDLMPIIAAAFGADDAALDALYGF